MIAQARLAHLFVLLVSTASLWAHFSDAFVIGTLVVAGPQLQRRSAVSPSYSNLFAINRATPGSDVNSVRDPKRTMNATISTCNSKDLKVINDILSDVRIRPPWRKSPKATTKTFNFVLGALVDHKSAYGPVTGPRAKKVLRYMLQESQQSGENSSRRTFLQPDVLTLNTVLAAYAKGNSPRPNQQRQWQQSADSAYRLLREWREQLYNSSSTNHQVQQDADIVSYNTVITLLGKAGQPRTAQQVFEELQQSKSLLLQPDVYTWNALLKAYAAAGWTDKVGDVFRRLRNDGPAPTIHSYNDVLNAYAKNPALAAQAEHFLDWWRLEVGSAMSNGSDDSTPSEMVKPQEEVVRPNTNSYNIVLHALGQVATTQQSSSGDNLQNVVERSKDVFDSIPVKDVVSYTTMIATYCRLLSPPAALSAVDSLLKEAWKDPIVQQNSAAFLSNVLYSIANIADDSKAMIRFAERIVQEAVGQGRTLDVSVYNSLLHCWSKAATNQRDAGSRVLSILSQLQDDPRCQPDASSYTNVLVALRGSGNSAENLATAEQILSHMERRGPPPTVQTYTALMMNYARSKLPNKAAKAEAVLRRMQENNVRPNIISYNAVLNACEYTNPSSSNATEQALTVACLVFDQVRKDPTVKPNHVTYGTFLAALGGLMPPAASRQEIVALVFQRCCVEGLVSGLVLRKLHSAVDSERLYRELLHGHNERQLPNEWTCHVRESRARDET